MGTSQSCRKPVYEEEMKEDIDTRMVDVTPSAQPPSKQQGMGDEWWKQQLAAEVEQNKKLIERCRGLSQANRALYNENATLIMETSAMAREKFQLLEKLKDTNAELINMAYGEIKPATVIQFSEERQYRDPNAARRDFWALVYNSDKFKAHQPTANEAPTLKALQWKAGAIENDEENSTAAREFGRIVEAIHDKDPQPIDLVLRRLVILPNPQSHDAFTTDEGAVLRALCDFVPVTYWQE